MIFLGMSDAPSIGFGCMGMTAFYGPPMKDEGGVALIAATCQAGYRHFDTAEVYQQSDVAESKKFNEELVGCGLADVPRSSFTIATKFFPGLHDGKCDYETVSGAVDASLARLGLPAIDLYYLHRMPATIEDLEEVQTVSPVPAAGGGRADDGRQGDDRRGERKGCTGAEVA